MIYINLFVYNVPSISFYSLAYITLTLL